MNDTKPKPVQTHILKAFRILKVTDKPQLAAIGFQTASGGRHRFVATRPMLERLTQELADHAKEMTTGDPGDAQAEPGEDPQDWFKA